jgi:hypothetical protein
MSRIVSDHTSRVVGTGTENAREMDMSSLHVAQSQQSDGRQSVMRRTSAARPQSLSGLEIGLLLVIAALLFIGVAFSHPRVPAVGASHTVRVQKGETLWSIAQDHPLPGLTTAQTAQAIADANGLPHSTLSAGQTIAVPVVDAPDYQMASR